MTQTTKNLRQIFNETVKHQKKHDALIIPVTTINLLAYRNDLDIHFPEIHTNKKDMIDLSLAPYKISKIEGVNLPFDMTLESESFGCEIDMRDESNMPEVQKTPFKKAIDVEIPDDFTNIKRMNILYDAIYDIRSNYPDLPIVIGIVGPFTLLGQLLGIEQLLKYIKLDYFEVEEALSVVVEALIEFIQKLETLDIDAVVVCEPSASCDLLDPNIFNQLLKGELEYIADETTKTNTILHVCGNTTQIIEDMLTSHYDVISIENVVSLNYVNEMRDKTKSDTLVAGNISTKTLLLGSTSDVRDEVFYALDNGIDILASSCSVPPYTPEVNVAEMVKARDEYYQTQK